MNLRANLLIFLALGSGAAPALATSAGETGLSPAPAESAPVSIELATPDSSAVHLHEFVPQGESALLPLAQLQKAYTRLLSYSESWSVAIATESISGRARPISPTAKLSRKTLFAANLATMDELEEQSDGIFRLTGRLALPDVCTSLHGDPVGLVWIGTESKGIFTYDPKTTALTPLLSPALGDPPPKSVKILGDQQQIVVIAEGKLLLADSRGQGLHSIKDPFSLTPEEAVWVPRHREIVVSYQHTQSASTIAYGVGVLSLDPNGLAGWRELDIAALGTISPIQSLNFSDESGRLILSLVGSEGVLRLDYEHIPTLEAPPALTIRANAADLTGKDQAASSPMPLKDHSLSLAVSMERQVRSKDWLVQTRFGRGSSPWSPPDARRRFEFRDLDEGTYHFDVRAVNSAGMTGKMTSMEFEILPPWYRTTGAYAGYAAALALGIVGAFKIRDRQQRVRHAELTTLVELRTRELSDANAAKDDFFATISHEIRNPMNGITGIAESIGLGRLDVANRHKIVLLRQCAKHLASLLDDILDFTGIQTGNAPLHFDPFDLHDLMESVTALTFSESERKGIPVEIAVSPSMPRHLVGHSRGIRQILVNYVNNALKHSGSGRVCVSAWHEEVTPGFVEVFFGVSDEGAGISLEEQAKLFTRFERGRNARKEGIPGTGLGLALCRALAGKMGGKVWAQSEPGRGSSFYFSAVLAAVPEEVKLASTPTEAVRAPLTNACALVVDDEEYNRIALSGLLETLGFTVSTAAGERDALGLAQVRSFDVVFLDYSIPGLDGPAIARALRALPNRSAQAFLLATTAFNTQEKRNECVAAGMNAFLVKPITLERLRRALASVVKLPAPEPASRLAPIDPLKNLRVLATKKNITFAEEVRLYLSELEGELVHLNHALQKEDAGRTSYYTHLLFGRCSFIQERELECILREVDASAENGQWREAKSIARKVDPALARLRVRITSENQAAPPSSSR